MTPSPTDRERVRRAREHLDGWTFDARDRAYAELFEGPDAALRDEELRTLDTIDSDLSRRDGVGLWGADEYGIVEHRALGTDAPRVVCTYHPAIPYEEFRGAESLDESTREKLNGVLWDYCERVAALVEEDLDAFLHDDRER